ncbi:MAG: molybdopterin-binding protein, partial [Oscillospiraceae bacterium]|nr:molybdopterin-binding protein [Oscillospiraceae bacterium]
ADLIICTGGMSVDPDDLTPSAIMESGANIISYGSPVLPGAMFLVSYNGDIPIIGLPGGALFNKRTAFDIVFPKILASEKITSYYIASLGHGGLCMECKECVFPNCGFGKG